MKAASVADEAQMQAACSETVSSDLSLWGPGHREVSFHEGDRCRGRCTSLCVCVCVCRWAGMDGCVDVCVCVGEGFLFLDFCIDQIRPSHR